MVLASNMIVTIRPIETAADLEAFLDVPSVVYANDPNWVPPIRRSIAKQLSPENTFQQYGTLKAFIAERSRQPVGRIVASVNRRLMEREGESIGLFGYFECIEEDAIARDLFAAAEAWLKAQGMTKVRGPIDLSTHNNCLFLVDGFDSQPLIMMPYNPSYYEGFMQKNGWEKAKDAYAYQFFPEQLPPEFEKGYRIALKSGVTFRPIHTKGEAFEQDCVNLYHLFNKAFTNNWSSSPRTLEEFLQDAQDLKSLVDPDLFPIAEYDGEMIGFFMALPDYNIALKHVNGKLNIWGILKFLWYKRQIDRARVIAICSLPEHRRKLVPLGLIYLALAGGTKAEKLYKWGELSWVYEDNMPSRKLIEASGGKIYKTYRIYEKDLA